VQAVLAGLQVAQTPVLLVWNKIDLLPEDAPSPVLGSSHAHSLAISAKTGAGLDGMLAKAEAILGESLVALVVVIPYGRYELVRLVYEQGTVESRQDLPEGVRLCASVPSALSDRLKEFEG
jgi:GTP-binding protein HflX